MGTLEDPEWIACLLRRSPEDQPVEVARGPGKRRQQAEECRRGRQRHRLEGLEAEEAALSQLGPLEDLGEEAALAGTGLAND